MPLVNCILSFCQPCTAFELVYFSWSLCYMFVGSPDGIEPTPSLIGVNPKDFTSHTYLVLHQVKLSTTNVVFEIWEVNGRLCIEEVGVDLELCVHAHGPNVELTMEASFKINYSFGISSSYIWDLAFLQSWFWPCSPLNIMSCAS